MKNQEKLSGLSSEHKEALRILAASKAFPAFEKLCKIQEHNIVVESFSVNSSDPQLAIKKSWYEGRLWELRKILKVFETIREKEDDES